MTNNEHTPISINIGPRQTTGDSTHLHDFLQTVIDCWQSMPELATDDQTRLNLFVNGDDISWKVIANGTLTAQGPSAASLVDWIEAQTSQGQDVIWP